MNTFCFFHPDCETHDPGPGHSERSARLTAILSSLRHANLSNLEWREAPLGHIDTLELVHDKDYIDFVFRSLPATGYQEIEVNEVASEDDGGEVTTLSPQSGNAVLRSVGAVTSAVDTIMTKETINAFCLTRPPGHHALPHKSMGFCVFNNIALAARYAQRRYDLERIAIIDFDVHHGNGTQSIFDRDSSVFFCSIHQLPLWPESGYAHEQGIGNILNVPTPPDLPRLEWLKIWHHTVLERLRSENFDFLMISAGFDAHKNDPKGGQHLEALDYYQITSDLLEIASLKCKGRVLSVLEGGYDIEASAASAVEHARALCNVALTY